jgi:hypothetical protein
MSKMKSYKIPIFLVCLGIFLALVVIVLHSIVILEQEKQLGLSKDLVLVKDVSSSHRVNSGFSEEVILKPVPSFIPSLIKFGISEDGFKNKFGASYLPKEWDQGEFDAFVGIPREYPIEWGKVSLISGDVVELESGDVIRRSIIQTDEVPYCILCVEIFETDGSFKDKSYFHSEMVLVETRDDNHEQVVKQINKNCHRDLIYEKAPKFPGDKGIIYVDSPSHVSGIFGFLENLNSILNGQAMVRLISQSEPTDGQYQDFCP